MSGGEVRSLQTRMKESRAPRGNFPFDQIFETIEDALEDAELQAMLPLSEQVTDPVANACSGDGFDIN